MNLTLQTLNSSSSLNSSASDGDGDDLAYAILFSADNGTSYSTLEIDYNQTTLTLNSTNLQGCNLCKIKVLATDGVNTNSSISDTFSVINNFKFLVTNSSDDSVAKFGEIGSILLKGTCTSGGTCTPPATAFIIQNATGDTGAYINSQGNLCIETGDCSDLSSSCSAPSGALTITNSSGDTVSHISLTGDLCYIGGLYENAL